MTRMTLASISLLALTGMTPAQAQNFPNKPIRVYSSYTAGTGADTVIRLVGAALSERIKQSVVIEQKLGAAGIVALTALKQAPTDGYTIGMVASSNAVQPSLIKNLPFDITKDFLPITNMYAGPMVVTIPSSLPARNLAEFISYAKTNAGKVFYGSAGVGSVSHLSGALLSNFGGFTMTHIPFKGTPEKNVAQLAGDIQISFDNY